MIRKAAEADRTSLAKLAAKLWGNRSEEELSAETSGLLLLTGAAFFLAEEDGQPVGLAQCQLRHDYVEGTDSSPAGYPEGTLRKKPSGGKGSPPPSLSGAKAGQKKRAAPNLPVTASF